MKTANWILMLLLGAVLTPTAVRAADEPNPRLDSLDDRITDLEAAQALQRVRFSGAMINRFEYFDTRYGVPGEAKEHDVLKPFSTYFAFNTDFDVTSRLKVYSTLAMSKFWQNDGRNEYAGAWQASEGGSYGYGGATTRFDRAYMAYTFGIPLTLAVGRMPTNQGVPINQLDGLAREGTYPRFAYNAIFDGIAAVFTFTRYLPVGQSLQLRAFYTPQIFVSKTDRTRQLVDGTYKVDSNALQYALLLEYSTSRLGRVADLLNVYYMFYQYSNFYNDGASDTTPPENPLDSAIANMAYVGVEGIGHIGLNASLSALLYRTFEKMLDGSSGGTTRSASFLANVNQRLDFIHAGTVIGAEFIKTDASFYLDEWTYLNVIPFYSTPASKGVHAFVSTALGDNLRVRLGWYLLHSTPYNVSGFASLDEADSQSFYVQLTAHF
jgi:hypothetical protein